MADADAAADAASVAEAQTVPVAEAETEAIAAPDITSLAAAEATSVVADAAESAASADRAPVVDAASDGAIAIETTAEARDATFGSPTPAGTVLVEPAVVGDGIEISPRMAELPVPVQALPARAGTPREAPQSSALETGASQSAPWRIEAADASAGVALGAASGLAASARDAVRSEANRPVEARDLPKRDGAEPPRSRELARIPAEPRIERSGDEAAARKLPFWKRIALPRAQPAPAAATPRTEPSRPVSLEPVLSGLAALEKQLGAHQSATEAQLRRFEDNLTRLWEVEDQMALTEVRERLALLEANQQEIADGLHNVSRNLVLLAVVLATAVAGGLLAVGLLL